MFLAEETAMIVLKENHGKTPTAMSIKSVSAWSITRIGFKVDPNEALRRLRQILFPKLSDCFGTFPKLTENARSQKQGLLVSTRASSTNVPKPENQKNKKNPGNYVRYYHLLVLRMFFFWFFGWEG